MGVGQGKICLILMYTLKLGRVYLDPFNISLQSGIYVDDWKLAKIIPIYKSEDRKECENYRPISILPVISKVFESEIFSQLYEHLNENTLFSDSQCGFRPKYGTNAALLEMCDL